MKKISLSLFTVALILTGIFIFTGCEKEENTESKIKKASTQDFFEFTPEIKGIIDEEATEIANYHDECIRNFIASFDFDNPYGYELFASIQNAILTTRYNHAEHWQNCTDFVYEVDETTINELLDCPEYFPAEFIQAFIPGSQNVHEYFNAGHIENICEILTDCIPEIMQNSDSQTDFYEQYYHMVNELLPTDNIYDYTFIRFYADVAISSFLTWIDVFQSMEFIQKEKTTWEKVKKFACEVAVETKIIMKADAVGAGVGAAVGAVKSVPTAVTVSVASGLTAAAPAWVAAGGVMASHALEYGAAGSLYKGVALLQSKR